MLNNEQVARVTNVRVSVREDECLKTRAIHGLKELETHDSLCLQNILIWCIMITFPTLHWHHLIALSTVFSQVPGLARSPIMCSIHDTRFLDRRTR